MAFTHRPKVFKETTKGHAVIMGRKNFESIPEKFRPLPGRTNIIVSRDRNYKANGCILVHSIEDAIAYAKSINEEEAFIIGGGEIYKQSMDLIDCLYITRVHSNFDGDTYFKPNLRLWKKYPNDIIALMTTTNTVTRTSSIESIKKAEASSCFSFSLLNSNNLLLFDYFININKFIFC